MKLYSEVRFYAVLCLIILLCMAGCRGKTPVYTLTDGNIVFEIDERGSVIKWVSQSIGYIIQGFHPVLRILY